jgi:hypothetical protein
MMRKRTFSKMEEETTTIFAETEHCKNEAGESAILDSPHMKIIDFLKPYKIAFWGFCAGESLIFMTF